MVIRKALSSLWVTGFLVLCLIFQSVVIHYMGKVIELQRIEIRELFKLAFPEQ